MSHIAEGVHSTCSTGFRLEPLVCGAVVEKLCMIGEKPVQKLTAQIFLRKNPATIASGRHVDDIFAPRFA
jgi:hypothetical protein